MNSQHEDLIKKLDQRFEDYQKKSNDNGEYKYYEIQKLSERIGISRLISFALCRHLNKENNKPNKENYNEFTSIVTDLKKEVSQALYQIRDIQGEPPSLSL